jgi:hypothetical protein
MKRSIAIIALSMVATFFIGQTIVLNKELKATKASIASIEQKCNDRIREIENQESSLSEWDMFTLALMKVESNYEPKAVSSVGAKGYFQIMPIYVAEVNRIHNTNYVYEDVVNSFELSYEVFTLMQEAHNKEYNMDKALRLHNGNHKWYKRRVYKEMANIEKYEAMRQKVKDASAV